MCKFNQSCVCFTIVNTTTKENTVGCMNAFMHICPYAFHTYAYIFEQHGVCMGAVSKSYTSHDVCLQFHVSDVETFFKEDQMPRNAAV